MDFFFQMAMAIPDKGRPELQGDAEARVMGETGRDPLLKIILPKKRCKPQCTFPALRVSQAKSVIVCLFTAFPSALNLA